MRHLLPPDALRPRCDPALVPWETTAEAAPADEPLGQDRALEALTFGARVRGRGFNLFVLGAPGSGRHHLVATALAREAAARPVPPDWCYVHDFAEPRAPLAIPLAAGRGRELAADARALAARYRSGGPEAARAMAADLVLRWADSPGVLHWLSGIGEALAGEDPSPAHWSVNLLVDRHGLSGAPLIEEPDPSWQKLAGRIEYVTRNGSVETSHTLIRPGALHRANGGFLVLDAERIVGDPAGWAALKRALFAGELRPPVSGAPGDGAVPVSLEPVPVPLDLKLVLVGSRNCYWSLAETDPDFPELFKVAADLADRVERDADGVRLYADLVASLARRDALPPFDRGAVSGMVEYGARLAGGDKLSLKLRSLRDLMAEAAWLATGAGRTVVTAADVAAADAARRRRHARPYEEAREDIRRRIILVDTQGRRIGQVNALSVLTYGDHSFGQPSRVTATARVGEGKVLDIEREVELGGALHSKGVLILSGYIGARYALELPLSLSASLVFEQSYGGVDGDSASVAEACALLSAIAELPVRQDLAVTGSMNQLGQVQAVDGINEKIECFFDVCRDRGLDGRQGVVVPEVNVPNLMLREDLVESVREGRFAVHAVRTLDEAASLLMAMPAGERRADGSYPEGTLNALVDARLRTFAEHRHEFEKEIVESPEDEDDEDAGSQVASA